MLGLTFSSKLDWDSYIISIAKTTSKKIGILIRCVKVLSPEVALYLYKSTIWNSVVMSGLVLLVATWNCWISYKNRCARLLVLHLLPLLNHWLIMEIKVTWNQRLLVVHLNRLNWFHCFIPKEGLLVILIDCMIFLSPFQDVRRCLCQQDSGILCLWNAFPWLMISVDLTLEIWILNVGSY